MKLNYIDKAIRAALDGKWEEAVNFNLSVLQESPNNVAALNRLARAYSELNKIEKAKKTYKKVIKIDKYNPIASKNLKRLKTKKYGPTNSDSKSRSTLRANFLEEPGKTKTTQLVRLADSEVISSLHVGQPLLVKPKKRLVSVTDENGTYIGSLPDDLSLRLGKLIRNGNRYEALIKGFPDNHGVQIFIRETERAKKLKETPSFPANKSMSYLADIRHAVLKQEPLDTRETGEKDS